MTSESFIDQLMNTEEVNSNPECMEIVQQAKELKTYMSTLTPSLSVCAEQAARPRLPNSIILTIGSKSEMSYPFIVIEAYDFLADRWNIVSNPGRGVYPYVCHGIVHCNGFVYCIGCYEDKNAMFRLDLTTHAWILVPSMRRHRCNASITVLNGLIYVIGGLHLRLSRTASRIFTLKSAERYDPETKRWRYIASMHEPRCMASCTLLHNRVSEATKDLEKSILKFVEWRQER